MLLLSLINPVFASYLLLAIVPCLVVELVVGFYYCKEKPWLFFGLFVFFFVLAFGVWAIDRFLCNEATNFFIDTIGFYPQLHALWHTFSVALLWVIVLTGAQIRLSADKKEIRTTYDSYTGMVPFVNMV